MTPIITTFAWVPEFARGFVRDVRVRWAFEEVGQPYAVNLIESSKTPEHRCHVKAMADHMAVITADPRADPA